VHIFFSQWQHICSAQSDPHIMLLKVLDNPFHKEGVDFCPFAYMCEPFKPTVIQKHDYVVFSFFAID
jgi:hypothetical protein